MDLALQWWTTQFTSLLISKGGLVTPHFIKRYFHTTEGKLQTKKRWLWVSKLLDQRTQLASEVMLSLVDNLPRTAIQRMKDHLGTWCCKPDSRRFSPNRFPSWPCRLGTKTPAGVSAHNLTPIWYYLEWSLPGYDIQFPVLRCCSP